VIPWRYHLVSIMAIFLALGLGVVIGTTVINPGLVKNLNNQTDGLKQDLRDLHRNVLDLQSQLDTMSSFTDQAMPYIVGDRLLGQQAVIVTEEGVDARAISETRRALDLSGAEVLTMLTVRPAMAATNSAAQHDLATLLGLSQTTPPDLLMNEAARALAERLARDPAIDVAGSTDVLGQLLSQGYLTSSAPGISDSTLEEIGGRGQLVVTIGGGAIEQLAPPSAAFLQPFVTQLLAAGVVTGAGESLVGDDGFVSELRATVDDSSGPLVTVDNVDQPVGGSAMVLAMDEAITRGTGGDYGVKDGASRLLPPAA
jgi:hypothetical protein